MKQRMTISVDERVAGYLHRQAQVTGGNISAYVEAHFAEQALMDSVRSHAAWFRQHGSYLRDAEAERATDPA